MKARPNSHDPSYLEIRCPGCKEIHSLNIAPVNGKPCWGFNGDHDNPTFSPSLLVRTGHYAVEANPEKYKGYKSDCWCNYESRFGEPSPFDCVVCHSFIRDGSIQFLSDCTHALAGQTVPLEDFQ